MDRVIFRYFPGNGIIHRFDSRFKLPAFALLCFAIIRSGYTGVALIVFLVTASVFISRLPLKILAVDFLRFLPLILILFTAVFLAGPTRANLGPSCMAAVRFALVILVGNLLIQTTSLRSISTAVAWYLKPVPFLREGRIATMIGLTISLIPLFFLELEESKHALASRGLSPRRRPFRWITFLLYPLLIRIFLKTDETAQAMEARCYTDERVSPVRRIRPGDWVGLGVLLLFSVSALII